MFQYVVAGVHQKRQSQGIEMASSSEVRGEIKIFPGEHRLVGFMVNKTCVWAA